MSAIIVKENKKIDIPSLVMNFSVEYDNNSVKQEIRFPLIVGNLGLEVYTADIYLLIENKNGSTVVELTEKELSADGKYVIAWWTVERAQIVPDYITIQFKIQHKTKDIVWMSYTRQISVPSSLTAEDNVIQLEPTVLQQMQQNINSNSDKIDFLMTRVNDLTKVRYAQNVMAASVSEKNINDVQVLSDDQVGTPFASPDVPVDYTMFRVENRTISIPPEITDILVKGDANSRVIKIRMPRYFDGIDLSKKVIHVNYMNAAGESGSDPVTGIETRDSTFTFLWTCSGGIATASGQVSIAIEIYALNTAYEKIYIWNTTPVSFNVLDTIQPLNNVTPYDYEYDLDFLEENDNSTNYKDMVDEHEPFIISNREIIKPTLIDFVVTQDTNSQLASFTMQRYFDGIDLSQKTICIKFFNANGEGDRAACVNVITTDTTLNFCWLIDGKVTVAAGQVQFQIEFIGYDSHDKFYCWQTTPQTFDVVPGLQVDDTIKQPSPSWIQSWQMQADQIVKESQENADAAASSAEDSKQSADASEQSANASQQSATQSANSASQSANSAIQSANSATASANSATQSANSATQSATSATASKNSASQAAQSATNAQQSATASGQSATQAAQSASQAAQSASNAQQSAQDAANSASEAEQTVQNASQEIVVKIEGYVDDAANSAAAAEESYQNAVEKVDSIGNSVEVATDSANKAAASASAAQTAQANAEAAKNGAEDFSTLSRSWAVGGTGTRQGEDTNNAKYWCSQAQEIVGADYVTTGEFNDYKEQVTQEIEESASGVTSELEQSIGSVQQNVTVIQGDITTIEGNITNIQDDVSDIQSDISAINTTLNGKQNTITGAATTITTTNLAANRALIANTSGKVGVSAVTSTELGYLDGVTSSIQTQLNSKQATITGGATSIVSANLTENRALLSDASGKVAVSAITNTELGYLDGVTSNIQTQFTNMQTQVNNRIATTDVLYIDAGVIS